MLEPSTRYGGVVEMRRRAPRLPGGHDLARAVVGLPSMTTTRTGTAVSLIEQGAHAALDETPLVADGHETATDGSPAAERMERSLGSH